jgi:hypothetical protein
MYLASTVGVENESVTPDATRKTPDSYLVCFVHPVTVRQHLFRQDSPLFARFRLTAVDAIAIFSKIPTSLPVSQTILKSESVSN